MVSLEDDVICSKITVNRVGKASLYILLDYMVFVDDISCYNYIYSKSSICFNMPSH